MGDEEKKLIYIITLNYNKIDFIDNNITMKFKHLPNNNNLVINYIHNISKEDDIELPNEIILLIYNFKSTSTI